MTDTTDVPRVLILNLCPCPKIVHAPTMNVTDPHAQLLLVVPGDEPQQIAESPHLNRLPDRVRIQLHRDRPTTREEALLRVRDANILINSRGNLAWTDACFGQLPKLKMITTCSIGVDAIDVEAANRRGIVVCNVPGRTPPLVAEHALALILGVARRLAFQTNQLKSGVWNNAENVYLRGKTLGVVGTGAIGSHVIQLARAIGMRVIAWTFNPSDERGEALGVTYTDLETLLLHSDVVSLHCKLTAASRGLIGAAELRLMKPGSILINTARAAVVDTAALADSLQSGHLFGAGIDVFDTEPLADDNPLLECEQVVLTPHAADQTPEGKDLLNEVAVDNVLAFLSGQPIHVV